MRGNSPQPVAGGSRGSERAGQPAGFTVGTDGRCNLRATADASRGVAEEEMRGNPEIHSLRAEGSGIRGNSKLHRRHSGKMQDAGQLVDASES